MATVNVFTQGEPTAKHGRAAAGAPARAKGLIMPGRTELIEEELHKAGLHVVANAGARSWRVDWREVLRAPRAR